MAIVLGEQWKSCTKLPPDPNLNVIFVPRHTPTSLLLQEHVSHIAEHRMAFEYRMHSGYGLYLHANARFEHTCLGRQMVVP